MRSIAYSWDNGATWYCKSCNEKLEPGTAHTCNMTVYFCNDKYFTLVNPPEVLGPDGRPVSSE